MTKTEQPTGRLAMRIEGDNWNAYYALTDSMQESVFLGSIRIGAVARNEARKIAFMQMMRDVVSDMIETATGERPTWGAIIMAPEHERSGRA